MRQKKVFALSSMMVDVLSEKSGADEKLEQLIVGINEL
jgi:DNA mismatch repair protein MSH3